MRCLTHICASAREPRAEVASTAFRKAWEKVLTTRGVRGRRRRAPLEGAESRPRKSADKAGANNLRRACPTSDLPARLPDARSMGARERRQQSVHAGTRHRSVPAGGALWRSGWRLLDLDPFSTGGDEIVEFSGGRVLTAAGREFFLSGYWNGNGHQPR